MKRRPADTPAVPATVPLAPDVSAPTRVDEATAAVTTAVAEALSDGTIDLDPAPVIDVPADQVSGADAVAIATAGAKAAAPVEPRVPVPSTQALPADQLTPELPVHEAAAGVAGRPVEEHRAGAVDWESVEAARSPFLGDRLAIEALAQRITAVELRLDALDTITLGLDGDGRVVSADADLPADRLAQLRRDILGASVADEALAGRPASQRRGFPVQHGVVQDGVLVRPLSRDRVLLDEREHAEAVAGGIVAVAWGDGDDVEMLAPGAR